MSFLKIAIEWDEQNDSLECIDSGRFDVSTREIEETVRKLVRLVNERVGDLEIEEEMAADDEARDRHDYDRDDYDRDDWDDDGRSYWDGDDD